MLFSTSQPAVAGLYLQLLSTFCISVMALVAKVAGKLGIPVMEIVLARSLVLLVMSTGMLAVKGERAEWPWLSPRCALEPPGGLEFGRKHPGRPPDRWCHLAAAAPARPPVRPQHSRRTGNSAPTSTPLQLFAAPLM